MTLPAKSYITSEEYLVQEQEADQKSEYYNGETYAMAGGTPEHDRITDDLMGELRLQLMGRPCETFTGNMRVKVSPTGLYTYPDGSVVCGTSEFEGSPTYTLLNPTLILEVLSSSTEAYDRGTKFAHYKTISSVKIYVLISQDRPRVETFTRQDDNTWLYNEIAGLDEAVDLPEIECRVPMSSIYRRVTFLPELSLHGNGP